MFLQHQWILQGKISSFFVGFFFLSFFFVGFKRISLLPGLEPEQIVTAKYYAAMNNSLVLGIKKKDVFMSKRSQLRILLHDNICHQAAKTN